MVLITLVMLQTLSGQMKLTMSTGIVKMDTGLVNTTSKLVNMIQLT